MTEDELIEQARAAAPKAAPTLETRLAAAKARRKAAADAAAPALELAAVEAEEKLAEAEEALAAVVKVHGPLRARLLMTSVGPIVLERGVEPLYTRFMEEHNKSKGNPADKEVRHFVYSCVAYPKDRKAIDQLFTEAPGALAPVAIELAALYGNKPLEDLPK